ncbi:MAG: IS701 family transposase [Phycisphaerae bacterium]|nr:IS701 family transposase [Phycisphaerae bacterium]
MARRTRNSAERYEEYLERLADTLGHADRRGPLRDYIAGLLLPGERKSVEPMAARLAPREVQARHQSMHHFVSTSPWDDVAFAAIARDHALDALERHGRVTGWVVDDTGMPKKGRDSVGVGRQYCGVLGKQENCQVAVSISLAHPVMSVPAFWRLYLPERWANDRTRREQAGIPDSVLFQTKWQIALLGIDRLLGDEIPAAPVLADAGYGDVVAFREGLTARGLSYVVGLSPNTTVWPPGQGPLPPLPRRPGQRGTTAKLLRRTDAHAPFSVEDLAVALPTSAWHPVRWREGTRGTMKSRFARVRVRPAHRDHLRTEPRPVETLLVEWPPNEPEPTKYWLSTLPEDWDLDDLVRLAKLRWRIERDFQELKDELGLDHYEGRGWRGFHHHGALCIAAYAWLAAERARLSPPEPLAFLQAAPLPEDYLPRGSPAAR